MAAPQAPDRTIQPAGSLRPYALSDVYERDSGPVYMTGMQALVRAVLEQRRHDMRRGWNTAGYVTGYRGSPLGGVDVAMTRAAGPLGEARIRFQPGMNEDLAATAIWGTQQVGLFERGLVEGVFGVWYGKGPGVDRSGDPFKHGNLAGTSPRGGVVVLAGDDHMCKSSTTAHQSEPALIAAGIPVLNPSSLEEVIPCFLASMALSRFSGLWTSMKCLTDTMDSSVSFDPALHGLPFIDPPGFAMPEGGLNIRRVDTPAAQEARLVDWKLPAARAFAAANGLDRITHRAPAARYGIVATGKSWLDLLTALRMLGLDEARLAALGIAVYKVALVWPLESAGLAHFAAGCREILIVEEKRPLVEEQAKAALYGLEASRRPDIAGKADPSGRPLLSAHGELDPVRIAQALSRRLVALGIMEEPPPLPSPADADLSPGERRVAWFCAGCPHNTSTRVPSGSLAGAGIGCHGLAAFNDADNTLPFTQMGGEGANWIGRAPFVDATHIFQNLGDGTFNHSGLLAIRAAVAAGTNITYKVLFNEAVAMTGGQAHDGALSVGSIAREVHAAGVARVAIVAEDPRRHQAAAMPPGATVHSRDELDAVQRALRDVPGVSVLVYDQACATERRRRRKRGIEPAPAVAVHINENVCEGCGDCGAASNCVAVQPVETPLGTKRRIDQTHCNVDLSCLKGFCPSFVTVEAAAGRAPRKRSRWVEPPAVVLPAIRRQASPCNILITGIGGTGIVTLSAILGMAAHLQGRAVRVMDQTGMAQKNGAVVGHVMIGGETGGTLPARVAPGNADVLLACDLLGAAAPASLDLAAAERTLAVVNADVTTTGRFTRDPDLDLATGANSARLARRVGAGAVSTVAAASAATALFGDATAANILLLGFAWQRGLVPLRLDALGRAIELNGAEPEMNKAAFGWGRAIAEGRAPPRGRDGPSPPRSSPADEVATLAAALAAYQDAAYARAFRDFVERVGEAETRLRGAPGALRTAVARSLHKLMAYKDEYEVARLLSDREQLAAIEAQHPPGARLRFHLAPPLLARTDARTGHPAKMSFGQWMLPVLRMLAAARRLRGTLFDPFGYMRERRREREAVVEYRATIERCLPLLDESTFETVLAVARLPMRIRGFGHVKEKARNAFEVEEARLMSKIAQGRKLL